MNKKENILQEHLLEGELVCWHGVAEHFHLLDTSYKVRIILKWLITLIVGGGLIAVALNAASDNAAKVVALTAVIMLLVIISPFLERRKLLGQEYWITDRRAIMIGRDGSFFSVKLDGLDRIRELDDGSDAPSFVLGGKVLEKDKDLRWRACRPMVAENGSAAGGRCDGLIFYCVSDAQGARDHLAEKSGLTIR